MFTMSKYYAVEAAAMWYLSLGILGVVEDGNGGSFGIGSRIVCAFSVMHVPIGIPKFVSDLDIAVTPPVGSIISPKNNS